MAGKQLDRKKPFAEIYGDTQGRRFEQDHTFFGPDEKEWIGPAAAAEVATPAKKLTKAEEKAKAEAEAAAAAEVAAKAGDGVAADSQLDAQLNG